MTKPWGKYDGSKPVAIIWNGIVVSENYKTFEVSDSISTSAVGRALKADTGKDYIIVPVDLYGNFEATDYNAKKVVRLLGTV